MFAEIAPGWLWLGGAASGYLLMLTCNPLRRILADAFNLLRERGRVRLWVPVAILSLTVGFMGEFALNSGETSRQDRSELIEVAAASLADGAAIFSSVVTLRLPDEARMLPVKDRVIFSFIAIFWVILIVSLQFFVLVSLYLGVVMPDRDPGGRGFLDFALRRTRRFWPGVCLLTVVVVLPLWIAMPATGNVAFWLIVALVACVFAFNQVNLLSGEHDFAAAMTLNFSCWRRLPYEALWFMIIVAVNLVIIHSADLTVRGYLAEESTIGYLWQILFSFIRAGVLVWLLAAWVLLFCARTKNPSRRRIRP